MKNLHKHVVAEEPEVNREWEIWSEGVNTLKNAEDGAWACITLTEKEEKEFLLDDNEDKYGVITRGNLLDGHQEYRDIVQSNHARGFGYLLYGMKKYKSKRCAQSILDEVEKTRRDWLDECVSNMDEIIEKAESMVGKQREVLKS